jgi:hypothetical protein
VEELSGGPLDGCATFFCFSEFFYKYPYEEKNKKILISAMVHDTEVTPFFEIFLP